MSPRALPRYYRSEINYQASKQIDMLKPISYLELVSMDIGGFGTRITTFCGTYWQLPFSLISRSDKCAAYSANAVKSSRGQLSYTNKPDRLRGILKALTRVVKCVLCLNPKPQLNSKTTLLVKFLFEL